MTKDPKDSGILKEPDAIATYCPVCHCFIEADTDECGYCRTSQPQEGWPQDPRVLEDRLVAKRFDIRRRLGRGGFAWVYLAWHTRLRCCVAMKLLRPADRGDARERMKREAAAVSASSSPFVAKIFDRGKLVEPPWYDEDYDRDLGGEDDEEDRKVSRPYFVMEYICGKDLRRVLHENGRYPWNDVVKIAVQVLVALEDAHDKGIYHRDIKAQNILIQEDVPIDHGVRVIDFGIAKIPKWEGVTLENTLPGSPPYIAPELLTGSSGGDPWTDLYALGIVMLEALTGECPFDEHARNVANPRLVLDAKMSFDALNYLYEHGCTDVPAPLERLLIQLTVPEPGQRPQSARSVLDQLNRFLASREIERAAVGSSARKLLLQRLRDVGLAEDADAFAKLSGLY